MSDGVDAPDSRLDVNPLFLGSPRLAHPTWIKNPVAAIEPAIISPQKRVGGFVGVTRAKAGQNLRLPVGTIVAVFVERKMRSGAEPTKTPP